MNCEYKIQDDQGAILACTEEGTVRWERHNVVFPNDVKYRYRCERHPVRAALWARSRR